MSTKYFFPRPFRLLCVLLLLLLIFSTASAETPRAKNVIVIITDGCGYNHYRAHSYMFGTFGQEVYDSSRTVDGKTYPWVKMGCTTFCDGGSFNPQKIDPDHSTFDLEYLKSDYTDSAASATALNTGIKTSNGRICYSADGKTPLESAAKKFAKCGKSVGTITTVQAIHATPVCVWGNNPTRKAGPELFNQIINTEADSGLNVVMGSGHAWYDNNGIRQKVPNYDKQARKDRYGGEYFPDKIDWDRLTNLTEKWNNWTFTDDPETIRKIADGQQKPPQRLFSVARTGGTFQAWRSKETARNREVPTLMECSLAALNTLDQDPDGFFLQIEAGAPDWMSHKNDIERLLEEFHEYIETISTVVAWVEKNSSWDETLLVFTSDHDTGMIRGADWPKNRCDFWVSDCGKGKLPGFTWNTKGHSNDIVPFFAIGVGSELFKAEVDGHEKVRRVDYIDNTDLVKVYLKLLDCDKKQLAK
jgi:alkaline phosphatase